MKLEEFGKEFLEEILAGTEAYEEAEFQENIFTETAVEYLVEVGECIDPAVAHYKARGVKLNAWELHEDTDSVDLLITIFAGDDPMRRIPRSEVEDAFQRARRFLEKALDNLAETLEEASEGFEPAQAIRRHASALRRARIYLITNGLVAPEPVEDAKVGRIAVSHHIWDLERFYQIAGKAGTREPIVITEEDLGGGIPCVKLPDDNSVYDAYIAIMPGATLAALYGRWGQRLLERNVRSYLQARGAVNKGIQDTIANAPGMFLAYNNGISTTGDAAATRRDDDGQLRITRIDNLQVVNGGQTTASLHDAAKGQPKRPPRSLRGIHVAMKLTVIKDPATLDEHVANISRFANSQTKVNVSDFSANDPFHIALERLSRATWAPNPDARGKATTKWYYERARGQYINELNAEGTPGKKRTFKIQYPTKQKLTKQLIAKYEMSWHQKPHAVSLGREKNFSQFMDTLADGYVPDEQYFHHLVAKAILFRDTDTRVREMQLGSHKANVVTYTIAWLSHLAGDRIDLDAIWENQRVDDELGFILSDLAREVRTHITNPRTPGMNYGEWAKKLECWTTLKARAPPPSVTKLLDPARALPPAPRQLTLADAQPEASAEIAEATAIPAAVWFGVAAWAKRTENLAGWQRSLAFSIGRLVARGREPSPKQAIQGMRLLGEAKEAGFDPEMHVR